MATYANPSRTSVPPFAAALTGIRRRWRWRHAAVGLALTLLVVLVAFWGAAGELLRAFGGALHAPRGLLAA